MYRHMQYTITGLPPGALQHNGRLANPLDPIVKQMAVLHRKPAKQKTDADREELIRLEWYGGLYVNQAGVVCWPGNNIEAMLRSAARMKRRGKDVEKGLICPESYPLLYDGPRDIDALWDDGRFLDVRQAKPRGQGVVMRARPYFPAWEFQFTVGYLPDILNQADVTEMLELAGKYVGLSDYGPKFGRFAVVKAEAID